jgi:hypothetical protein
VSKQSWQQDHWHESQHLPSAAVIMSVAALEASVNELYLEAVDGNAHSLRAISVEHQRLLATFWDDELDRAQIMKKYKLQAMRLSVLAAA